MMSTSTTEELRPIADEAAAVLKTLSHPYRLMICCQLLDGPMGVGELETLLELKQPNLSRELSKLRTENILSANRDGISVKYRIKDIRIIWILEGLRRGFRGDCLPTSDKDNQGQLGQSYTALESFAGSAMFARTIPNTHRQRTY